MAYVIFTFGLLPVILLGLSAASAWLAVFVGIPFVIFLLVLVTLIGLRANKPHLLPESLKRDPAWLIESLRVQKTEQETTAVTPATSGAPTSAASSADLGK